MALNHFYKYVCKIFEVIIYKYLQNVKNLYAFWQARSQGGNCSPPSYDT